MTTLPGDIEQHKDLMFELKNGSHVSKSRLLALTWTMNEWYTNTLQSTTSKIISRKSVYFIMHTTVSRHKKNNLFFSNEFYHFYLISHTVEQYFIT